MVVRWRKFWWTASALMLFLFGGTLQADVLIYPAGLPGFGRTDEQLLLSWAKKVFWDNELYGDVKTKDRPSIWWPCDRPLFLRL